MAYDKTKQAITYALEVLGVDDDYGDPNITRVPSGSGAMPNPDDNPKRAVALLAFGLRKLVEELEQAK